MPRFTSFAIAVAVTGVIVGLVGRAHAQSHADIAAKYNEEGKELMYQDKYAEAAKAFAQAVAHAPEAKYFVNLCAARLQEGKLDDALTACHAVELNNPSAEQKTRSDKLIERINEEAKKQNLVLHDVGGGGQNGPNSSRPNPNPDPSRPTYTPAVGRPLDTNLVVANRPEHRYTWALGFDLYGGGGRVGQPDFYGAAVGGLRIKTDYMVAPLERIGVQAYLQFSHLSQGRNQMAVTESLDIGDFGLAAYKHICLGGTPAACVTPLAGLQLAFMGPADDTDAAGSQLFNYAGLGGRFELAFTYAFGRRYEHAVSLTGGLNVYTPILSGPSLDDGSGQFTAEERGLDTWGATGYLGIGYTFRFNTPVGATPLIILE
jgi:tetratricopeptide (TPR) repeat protein